jgi:beta-glucanase (GH16 family)
MVYQWIIVYLAQLDFIKLRNSMKLTTLTLLIILGLFLGACKPEKVTDPQISIGDATNFEGDENSTLDFPVTITGENTAEIRVDYQTQAGSASSEEDFVSTSGTLTIPAGETSATISVVIIGESEKEEDEDFKVILSNPVGATLLDDEAKGLILDDDRGKLVIPETGYSTPETYAGMNLIWQDEFEGTEVNRDDWTFEIGNGSGGWGNNELQFYREQNASVVDGNLVITAKFEPFSGYNYTSTRMITKGKQEFTYGRIDIRAVMPEGQGIWPALWMLGGNIDSEGWPACGEIDIMELVGHEPGTVHGTVHYGNDFPSHQYTGKGTSLPNGAKFSEEFHVFSIEWQEGYIKWYMDDQLYFEVNDSGIFPYPFNQDFFFIFNVAVGGNWPGSPDNTTIFPQYMVVDYVRVFQNQ